MVGLFTFCGFLVCVVGLHVVRWRLWGFRESDGGGG